MFWLITSLCIALTILKVWDSLVDRKSKYYKPIMVGLAICSGILGWYTARGLIPSNPNPMVKNLHFYAYGIPNSFNFCCEFEILNQGDKGCKLDKVEFMLDKTQFKFGKSALVTKGRTYSDFSGIAPLAVSSPLPTIIAGKYQNQFTFVGEGRGNMNVSDFPQSLGVKLTFLFGKKPKIITERATIVRSVDVQPPEF
jgi:hypothetical protein